MSLADEILRTGSGVQDQHGFSSVDRKPKHLIQDTITPYKICVLILVRLYLESKWDDGVNAVEYSYEEKRVLMLLFMELIKVPDMSFNHLGARIKSAGVNPMLIDRFNGLVLRLANGGPCEYFSFFERLNEPIRDNFGKELTEFTILNKTSVIGIVVRSMLVGFKMMSLEEVISSLISNFSSYCKELRRKNNFNQPELSPLSTRSSKRPVPSKWQSERRITQLALMLEHNAREIACPAEISEELNTLAKTYPSLHRVHYVMYLNHMRVKEHAGAKECLHRYFDKMAEAGAPSCVEDFNRCSRYASLNLASLYARFGHREMAIHSVKEAVKLAQETNDKACLQHALVWLEQLSDPSNGRGVAVGQGIWDLSLTGSLIKTLKYTPLTETPERVFSELTKGLYFQTRFLRMSNQSSLKAALKLSQMTLCSSLWNYYGQRNMSSLISLNVLHMDSSDQGRAHCSEPECLALCVLSNLHFSQGDYESSESILSIAKESFASPYPLSDIWGKVEQCQLSDRAFYHGDVEAMSLACENLMALDPVEAALRKARLCSMQCHYQSALGTIKQVLSSDDLKSPSYGNRELVIRTTLELIHVYCELKDHSNATKYIIDCMEMATDNHLLYQHALCQLYAAHIQLMSNNAEEGFMIMREYLSYFLINGSSYDKGRAQVLYTKCRIARAKTQTEEKFFKVIVEGLQLLEKAKENFQLCEAFVYLQDLLMYMAVLCNMVGERQKRNEYAYQYRQIELKLSLNKDFSRTSIVV